MDSSRAYLANFSRFVLIIFIFVSGCHILIKYGNIILQEADAKAPPAPAAPPAHPQGMILGTITALAFFGNSLNTHALDIPVIPTGTLSERTIDQEIQQQNFRDQQIQLQQEQQEQQRREIRETEEPKMEFKK
jgi:hypothetical protein